MRNIIITLSIALLTLTLPLNLMAAETEIALSWDPNVTAPYEYQVFCREAGQNYDFSNPVYQGESHFTQCTVSVDTDKQYYFVAHAVSAEGAHSSDSNEVSYPYDGNDRSVGGDGDGGGISSSSCFIKSLLAN